MGKACTHFKTFTKTKQENSASKGQYATEQSLDVQAAVTQEQEIDEPSNHLDDDIGETKKAQKNSKQEEINDDETQKKIQSLRDGPVFKTLTLLSIPSMIGFSGFAVSNTVQQIMIGNLLNDQSLTGHANSLPTENLFFSQPGGCVAVGATALMSTYMGKHQYELAGRAQAQTFLINMVIGIVVPLIFVFWLPQYLTMLGVTAAILPYSLQYLYPDTIIMPMVFGVNNASSLLRCQNKAFFAMWRQLFGSMSALVLCGLFLGLFWRSLYAVITSLIISYSISGFWLLCYLFSRKATIRLKWRYFKPEWKMIRQILLNGLANFASVMPVQLYNLLSIVLLNKYSNDDAAKIERLQLISGIASRVQNMYQIPLNGFVSGMQPILGYSLGSKMYARVYEVISKEYIILMSIGAVFFLIIQIFAYYIVSWFTKTQSLYVEGANLMRISMSGALLQLFLQIQCIILQQEKRSGIALALQMVRVGVSLCVMLILPVALHDPQYVFYSSAAGDIAGGLCGFVSMIITFKKYKKLKMLDVKNQLEDEVSFKKTQSIV